MKVLLLNGSPHARGCTNRALREIADTLAQEGIESEIFWLGAKPVGGCVGCGACGSMTTASSMCFIAEALGMTVPGNASINAADKRLGGMGYEAGRQVMRMLREGITARKILTEQAIENAIIVDTAVAGSTNLLLQDMHLDN